MLMADNMAYAALAMELQASERMLWSGMPRQGLRLRAGDVFMIPLSLFWGGFVFFWEYTVLNTGNAPVFMVLWGVPFVVVGVYLIIGRFFWDSYQRSCTYYAVTDQRALIVSGIFSRQVKGVSLSNLNELTLTERVDGSGDIVFGPVNPMGGLYSRSWPGTEKKIVPTFELVENVRQVYDIIHKVHRKK
jgi:hypothetical protein